MQQQLPIFGIILYISIINSAKSYFFQHRKLNQRIEMINTSYNENFFWTIRLQPQASKIVPYTYDHINNLEIENTILIRNFTGFDQIQYQYNDMANQSCFLFQGLTNQICCVRNSSTADCANWNSTSYYGNLTYFKGSFGNNTLQFFNVAQASTNCTVYLCQRANYFSIGHNFTWIANAPNQILVDTLYKNNLLYLIGYDITNNSIATLRAHKVENNVQKYRLKVTIIISDVNTLKMRVNPNYMIISSANQLFFSQLINNYTVFSNYTANFTILDLQIAQQYVYILSNLDVHKHHLSNFTLASSFSLPFAIANGSSIKYRQNIAVFNILAVSQSNETVLLVFDEYFQFPNITNNTVVGNSTINSTNTNATYTSNNTNIDNYTNYISNTNVSNNSNIETNNTNSTFALINNSLFSNYSNYSNNSPNISNANLNTTNSSSYFNSSYSLVNNSKVSNLSNFSQIPYKLKNNSLYFCLEAVQQFYCEKLCQYNCQTCSHSTNRCSQCRQNYVKNQQNQCVLPTRQKAALFLYSLANMVRYQNIQQVFFIFDGLQLYKYHRTAYTGYFRRALDYMSFLSDNCWTIFPIPSLQNWISQPFDLPSYNAYTNIKFQEVERNDSIFLQNTKAFFLIFVPLTMTIFYFLNKLFYKLFEYSISSWIRIYSFWLYLLFMIVFQNTHILVIYSFVHLQNLFQLGTSIFFVHIICVLLIGLIFICLVSLFPLSFYVYKHLTKYFLINVFFIDGCYVLTFVRFTIKPILQSCINVFLYSYPKQQLVCLTIISSISVTVVVFLEYGLHIFKNKGIFWSEWAQQCLIILLNLLLLCKHFAQIGDDCVFAAILSCIEVVLNNFIFVLFFNLFYPLLRTSVITIIEKTRQGKRTPTLLDQKPSQFLKQQPFKYQISADVFRKDQQIIFSPNICLNQNINDSISQKAQYSTQNKKLFEFKKQQNAKKVIISDIFKYYE